MLVSAVWTVRVSRLLGWAPWKVLCGVPLIGACWMVMTQVLRTRWDTADLGTLRGIGCV